LNEIGGGYGEWGAVKGEKYSVFKIHEVHQNMQERSKRNEQ
jgi:hypothetical protein